MGRSRGTKDEVFAGVAKKTAGGLSAGDLMRNSRGKVISKKQHEAGKRNIDRLKKHRFVKKNATS